MAFIDGKAGSGCRAGWSYEELEMMDHENLL